MLNEGPRKNWDEITMRHIHRIETLAVFVCLPVLVLAMAGCARSPEARSARYLEAGKKCLEKKDYARAILEFKNAANARPGYAETYYQLGLAFVGAGDYQTAVGGFRRALDINPKHTAAQMRLADLLAHTRDTDMLQDAESRLRKILGEPAFAVEALDTLAFTELKLGKLGDAMEHLQQVLARSPAALRASMMLVEAKLLQQDAKGAEEVLLKAVQSAPKSEDAAIYLGLFYIGMHRPAEAEQQFRHVLQMNPKNASALFDLAKLQGQLGRKAEAEQNLKALSLLPEGQLNAGYAMFLFEEGRRDEAIREFERLAKASPDDRLARTRLVTAYRATGRVPDAEKVLAAALKKNRKDLDALLQRAELLTAAGKYNEAQMELNQVLKLRPTSPELHYTIAKLHQQSGKKLTYRQELSEALKLNPSFLVARLDLAESLLRDGATVSALDTLNEAPDSQKQLPAVLAQRNWALWGIGDMAGMRKGIDEGLKQYRAPELLIEDGMWKLRHGEIEAARKSFNEALNIDATDLRALEGLKNSYTAQNQAPLGLQKVKEYATAHTNSAPVQQFLGALLAVEGDRAQARAALNAAKAADPQYQPAELTLVQLDVADGKFNDARRRLEALVAKDKGDATPRVWLGVIEQARGDSRAAIQHYREAIGLQSDNAQALNNLAWSLLETAGQPEEALKYAEKATELAPNNPAHADTLGWALYRRGLYDQSVKQFEHAVKSKASSRQEAAVWQYHLAMAYAKSGDAQRGRLTLEAALKLAPNLPEAAMARQALGPKK